MSYSKEDIIIKVNESINNVEKVHEVYKQKFINYIGKTTDTKDLFTEVVAEELLRNDNFIKSMSSITEIVRGSGYIVSGHDGISLNDESNRKEEMFCKALFNLSKIEKMHFSEIGTIFDYQVPLKNNRGDNGVGKIDLISKTAEAIWLLELKIKSNKETVLRCVLEIATYYQLLSKSAFIKSYPEYSGHLIRKGILVMNGSNQEAELQQMRCGGRNNLKKLMKILKVEAFTIDEENKRVVKYES